MEVQLPWLLWLGLRSSPACLLPTGGEGRGSREGSAAPPAYLEPVNCTVMECISPHGSRFEPSGWL